MPAAWFLPPTDPLLLLHLLLPKAKCHTLSKYPDGILPSGNHFGLISLRIADVKQILGARYPIIKEQISRFLEHFPHMLVQASANENRIELRLNSTIKSNNP